jgi:cell division protein ZapA (FtsZ GTPase activity inhibitor)
MERNSTDVIIEDKVYKISTDQDASYVRELAEYINEKMELLHRQSAYSKQANAFRQRQKIHRTRRHHKRKNNIRRMDHSQTVQRYTRKNKL